MEVVYVRSNISASKRKRIYKRDNYLCQYCGKDCSDGDISIDHIIPISAGGSESDDNLCVACYACNSKKRDMAPDEFKNQLKISKSKESNKNIENERDLSKLFEALYTSKLSGSQFSIVLLIVDFTWLNNKDCAKISGGYIAEKTNLHDVQAKKEIKKMINSKILKVYQESTYTKARVLGINQNYSEWESNKTLDLLYEKRA